MTKAIRQEKRITQEIDAWEPPSNAFEFLKFWADRIKEIPEENRDTATINVECEDHYDGQRTYYELICIRKETQEEADVRSAQEGAERQRLANCDRTVLEIIAKRNGLDLSEEIAKIK